MLPEKIALFQSIQATVGVSSLAKAEFIERREANPAQYYQLTASLKSFFPLHQPCPVLIQPSFQLDGLRRSFFKKISLASRP